jgi:catechol 2,3-dioxygenase-like lactoylglutathione lyase family enzyme
MKLGGVNHVSINVRDLEASARFYAEVLGFRRHETVPMDGGFSITYLEIPGGGRMELFDYHGRSPEPARPEEAVGLRHLAFTVDDVAAAERLLRERGVTVTLPTTDIPALRARVVLFLDPNGVTLELCQPIAAAAGRRDDHGR